MPTPRAASTRLVPALPLVALLALLAGPAAAQEDAPPRAVPLTEADFARVVDRVIDGHVLPAVRTFRDAADRLAAAVPAVCAAPTDAALADARAAFAAAADAFAALDPVRFGPVTESNRLERLNFWPDPRGLGLKQIQALLAKEHPAALDPAALAGKSVAVQGLGALEFVLHGTGAEALAAPGSYRCRYGAAVAANVAGVAGEIVAGWETGSGRRFREPGPDNPLFLTHEEAASELLSGMATALEILSDQKLKTVLADTPERAKPRLAPFWRSGRTFPSMAATLGAIEHEMTVGGFAEALEPGSAWLASSVGFELRNARRMLETVGAPPEAAYTDPKPRGRLVAVMTAAASLKFTIGSRYATALGLQQGFNALDGD